MKIKLLTLGFLAIFCFYSCEKDLKIKNSNQPKLGPVKPSRISGSDASDILTMAPLVASVLEEMSYLGQTDFCELKAICSNENLTDSAKFANIQTTSGLEALHQSMVNLKEFVEEHSELMETLREDGDELGYLDVSLRTELGDDVNAPNNDPCAQYKAGNSTCNKSFLICLLGVAVTTEGLGIPIGV